MAITTLKNTKQDVVTVSFLNQHIKRLLENNFPSIWVEGELTNLACPVSGHIYFTLKDKNAQVRCALFKRQAMQLGFRPENGALVRVKAKVSLYEPRGDYQLIASQMVPAGEGALQQTYEVLKRKLQQAGWFDEARKRELPPYPNTVGVITSPTGAALQDILQVLERRCPYMKVIVYPTQVQGVQATPHLLKALKQAAKHDACDVLIVARGGGSLEDLWAFNDEKVAKAILESKVPVVSAVGHETDVTIADFVADVRAPTPSAAAELVSPDQEELLAYLGHQTHRLMTFFERYLNQLAQQLDWLFKRLKHPSQKIAEQKMHLAQLVHRMILSMEHFLAEQRGTLVQGALLLKGCDPKTLLEKQQLLLAHHTQNLQQQMHSLVKTKRFLFMNASRTLETVSPLATLNRGYTAVNDKKGRMIVSAKEAKEKDELEVRFKDGVVCVEVL